jgi:hypothetical protein
LTPKFSPSDSRVLLSGSASGPRVFTSHEPRITNHAFLLLTPVPTISSKLFCTPFHPKSLPCHSYEYMGGGGYPPRVHISLNPKHLDFPTLPGSGFLSTSHEPQTTSHSPVTPYPPSHTRSRSRKSFRAFTYVFRPNLSPYAPSHTKIGGWGPRTHLVTIPLLPHLIPGDAGRPLSLATGHSPLATFPGGNP